MLEQAAIVFMCLMIGYVTWLARKTVQQGPTQSDVLRCIRIELARLLPLPQTGIDGLIGLLDGVAPGRALAVFTVGEPPLRVAARAGLEGDEVALREALYVDRYGDELATGRCAHDEERWLLPLRSKAGRLVGAVYVAGGAPVELSDLDRWALDVLAGYVARGWMLSEYSAQYLANWRFEDLTDPRLPGPRHGRPSSPPFL